MILTLLYLPLMKKRFKKKNMPANGRIHRKVVVSSVDGLLRTPNDHQRKKGSHVAPNT